MRAMHHKKQWSQWFFKCGLMIPNRLDAEWSKNAKAPRRTMYFVFVMFNYINYVSFSS